MKIELAALSREKGPRVDTRRAQLLSRLHATQAMLMLLLLPPPPPPPLPPLLLLLLLHLLLSWFLLLSQAAGRDAGRRRCARQGVGAGAFGARAA